MKISRVEITAPTISTDAKAAELTQGLAGLFTAYPGLTDDSVAIHFDPEAKGTTVTIDTDGTVHPLAHRAHGEITQGARNISALFGGAAVSVPAIDLHNVTAPDRRSALQTTQDTKEALARAVRLVYCLT